MMNLATGNKEKRQQKKGRGRRIHSPSMGGFKLRSGKPWKDFFVRFAVADVTADLLVALTADTSRPVAPTACVCVCVESVV